MIEMSARVLVKAGPPPLSVIPCANERGLTHVEISGTPLFVYDARAARQLAAALLAAAGVLEGEHRLDGEAAQ